MDSGCNPTVALRMERGALEAAARERHRIEYDEVQEARRRRERQNLERATKASQKKREIPVKRHRDPSPWERHQAEAQRRIETYLQQYAETNEGHRTSLLDQPNKVPETVTASIRCGSCGQRHVSVAEVRRCHGFS